jgi:hypothetical protein
MVALGAMTAPLAASPIDTMNVIVSNTSGYVAGSSTDTVVVTFTGGGVAPDAGETILFEMLDGNGIPVANSVSPASHVTTGASTFFGGALNPFTFYLAGANLTLRARAAGVTDDSIAFSVTPGAVAKILLVAPGETHSPGRNPATSGYTGKTGAPLTQLPNQTFSVRVLLTDTQFNIQTSASNQVAFAGPSLFTAPSPTPITNGDLSLPFTITGPSLSGTVTGSAGGLQSGSVDLASSGAAVEEVFITPNPFNPHTGTAALQFSLAQAKSATVRVFDRYGREVWRRDGSFTQGFNSVAWDGKNDRGVTVAAGVYYVVLEVDGSVKSKKRIGVTK